MRKKRFTKYKNVSGSFVFMQFSMDVDFKLYEHRRPYDLSDMIEDLKSGGNQCKTCGS